MSPISVGSIVGLSVGRVGSGDGCELGQDTGDWLGKHEGDDEGWPKSKYQISARAWRNDDVAIKTIYVFLTLVLFAILISHRIQHSRIGRAWMAIREDEVAAKAMGINTTNMKLLAFGMGATFGGVSGAMFASFQGFISPESFSLMESVMIVAMVVLGGLGYLPGVILGAILLSALPEVLRYVAGPLQEMTGGRLDASIMRQLLVALAMIVIMLMRPRGLWPSPEHGKSLKTK